MIYIVNYQEGSRGSFISYIMGLMLNNDTTTPMGLDRKFGDVSRGFLEQYKIDIDPNDYPNTYLKLKYDSDFIIIPGLPLGRISFDEFTKAHPEWVALYITYEPEERLLVHVTNIYKNFYKDEPAITNYYWKFYLKNKNILDREVASLKDMAPDELRKLLIAYGKYIDRTTEFDRTFNTIFLSTNWDGFVSSVPEQYRNRIHRLNFSDITNDKEKVLNKLSEITKGSISNHILRNYDNYLKHQTLPANLMETICMN